jgi:hypothetical protein
MKSFVKRQKIDVDTTFVLRGINPAELDKQYSMKEFIDVANREFGFSVDNFNNELFMPKKAKRTTDLKTKLENLGIVKDHMPRIETIVISESLNFKICLSPTNNGDAKDLQDLRKVCCWHCKHHLPQKVYPLSLPMMFNNKLQRFEGEGVFCSFNCMLSYSREYSNNKYRDCGGLICLLYKKIFGKNINLSQISCAPNWRMLESFGGPLSIEEFRKTFQVVEYKENYLGKHDVAIIHPDLPLVTRSEVFIANGDC